MTMQISAEGSPPRSSDILRRLRAESRSEHDAIDRVLDLLAGGLTRESYRLRVQQLHGFYAPLEERLEALGAFARLPEAAASAAASGPRQGIPSRQGPERKTPLLLADLVALGVAAPERLPRCEALPDLTDPARVLGCLYVLEGATLGGQVIARHLRDTLGVDASNGGSFFHGPGEATGPRWRAFCATLVAFSGDDEGRKGAMVDAAIETFRALRSWFEACEARDARDEQPTHE